MNRKLKTDFYIVNNQTRLPEILLKIIMCCNYGGGGAKTSNVKFHIFLVSCAVTEKVLIVRLFTNTHYAFRVADFQTLSVGM